MMELKLIKGELHIVTMDGKKEVAQTPADAIKQARKRIADATFMLTNLANTRAMEQSRLEDAVESGISTAPARKELATITEMEADQDREISDAQNDIRQIEKLLDEHRENEIFDAMARSITAATAPLNAFLETIK
jgi:hypothetical protein